VFEHPDGDVEGRRPVERGRGRARGQDEPGVAVVGVRKAVGERLVGNPRVLLGVATTSRRSWWAKYEK
jgi:hypothetical protein